MKTLLQSARENFAPPTKQEIAKKVDPLDSLPASVTNPKRILLVDDDKVLVELLEMTRTDYNFNMTLTSTESIYQTEALFVDIKGDPPYDIIILDVKLTNGSGVDLYSTLIRRWPFLNVIFFTGFGTEYIRAKVEAIGPARIHSKEKLLTPEFLAALLQQLGVHKGAPPIENLSGNRSPESPNYPVI